jgi:hypothetical protein
VLNHHDDDDDDDDDDAGDRKWEGATFDVSEMIDA